MDNENDSIHVEDNSRDREYFTIIPNYIVNHSTANAQALYLQLKRLAGESGKAFPSMRYLEKNLHLKQNTIRKELGYLLEKGWIIELDRKTIITAGGPQKVRCFKVVDLWKMNMEFYTKGGSKEDVPSTKGVQNSSSKGVQNSSSKKIPSEEEPLLAANAAVYEISPEGKEPIPKKERDTSYLEAFKVFSPRKQGWWLHKAQIEAARRLLEMQGLDQIKKAVAFYRENKDEKFIPEIHTPFDLEAKWLKLHAWKEKH